MLLTILLTLLAAIRPAHAGTPCEPKRLDAGSFGKAMTLTERTLAALDQSSAQVALIARVGQDLSQYGLRYSHMAYVWRDHPQGPWLVVHERRMAGKIDTVTVESMLRFVHRRDAAAREIVLAP